jgi:hypothetical protein
MGREERECDAILSGRAKISSVVQRMNKIAKEARAFLFEPRRGGTLGFEPGA